MLFFRGSEGERKEGSEGYVMVGERKRGTEVRIMFFMNQSFGEVGVIGILSFPSLFFF